jgi:hypothetical protein
MSLKHTWRFGLPFLIALPGNAGCGASNEVPANNIDASADVATDQVSNDGASDAPVEATNDSGSDSPFSGMPCANGETCFYPSWCCIDHGCVQSGEPCATSYFMCDGPEDCPHGPCCGIIDYSTDPPNYAGLACYEADQTYVTGCREMCHLGHDDECPPGFGPCTASEALPGYGYCPGSENAPKPGDAG